MVTFAVYACSYATTWKICTKILPWYLRIHAKVSPFQILHVPPPPPLIVECQIVSWWWWDVEVFDLVFS